MAVSYCVVEFLNSTGFNTNIPDRTSVLESGTSVLSAVYRAECWRTSVWHPGIFSSSYRQSLRSRMWSPDMLAHGSTCSVTGNDHTHS